MELHGGWHNVFNGIAGILNIFIMTGWFGIYVSKKKQDMLWPDMTWVFIISYDIWNFCYTYNCLPTHSWYCGLALLLAPTVAGMLWNKGGWIQNRANTLALWCMFCQACPLFANDSIFAVQSVNDPNVNLVVSLLALGANIAALGYVAYRSKKLGRNAGRRQQRTMHPHTKREPPRGLPSHSICRRAFAGYSACLASMAAWPAARRASGTRYGLQDT